MPDAVGPVVILGAGINGAALARELTLGGLSVVVVDAYDLAYGTTAYSSRLIHGGLRYLEYGEFDLVKESLAERTRLLRLAPQFVRPLKLFIPVANRFGGLLASAGRFFGFGRGRAAAQAAGSRGAWLVQAGLRLYDAYARDPELPKHQTFRTAQQHEVCLDAQKYPWVCAYYDAQILFPERFVVALLDDARQAAEKSGVSLEIFTYHRAELNGRRLDIHSLAGGAAPVRCVQPAAIVNATGAWVDRTLAELHVKSPTLMAGTKGSHFITAHAGLRAALGDHGLYAEAADGRPVFILPFGDASLVGTTDLPYEGDPADAVAEPEEIEYLLGVVNALIPNVRLVPSDVDLHYCGVRPLPYVGPSSPAAVTRRHWLEAHLGAELPVYSIIGGKLTTCRSLAEESAGAIRQRLGLPTSANSRDRPLPGGDNYPADAAALVAEINRLAEKFSLSRAQIAAVWRLRGTQTEAILDECLAGDKQLLVGVDLPLGFARWTIRHEWVRRLDDLVERRLMLLYDRRLSEACLKQLAELLVEAGLLPAGERQAEVRRTIERLQTHFGKRLKP